MSDQLILPAETLVALVAFERFHARVSGHVSVQLPLPDETLVACVASERSVSGVGGLVVE